MDNSLKLVILNEMLLTVLGRNVVLEVPRLNNSNVRISSHVLSAQGNEIFMHCLSFNGRSIAEDRASIEDLNAKPNYRLTEFAEFVKSNTLSSLSNDVELNFNLKRSKTNSILHKNA